MKNLATQKQLFENNIDNDNILNENIEVSSNYDDNELIKSCSSLSICSYNSLKNNENLNFSTIIEDDDKLSTAWSDKSKQSCQCYKKKLLPNNSYIVEKGQTLLTDYFTRHNTSNTTDNLVKINAKYKINYSGKSSIICSSKSRKRKRIYKLIPKKQLNKLKQLQEYKKYRRHIRRQQLNYLKTKIFNLLKKYHFNFRKSCEKLQRNKILLDTFISFQNFINFVNLLSNNIEMSMKRLKLDEHNKTVNVANSNAAAGNTDQDNGLSRKTQRSYNKAIDNTRLMMLPENKEDSCEKDFSKYIIYILLKNKNKTKFILCYSFCTKLYG